MLQSYPVPDAASAEMGEAWALEDAAPGSELAPCGPVLVLPTFSDPHLGSLGIAAGSSRGASAGRLLPSAHAGMVWVGTSAVVLKSCKGGDEAVS